MLAQSFLDASALSIPETHRQALMKTLVLLETGKLVHMPRRGYYVMGFEAKNFTGHFNMAGWQDQIGCDSVCCIGGTAELIGDVAFERGKEPDALGELFYLYSLDVSRTAVMESITPAQAAIALRSYLTTGAANWGDALREETE